MHLDVKNLVFGSVGEKDHFDLSLKDYKLVEGLLATNLEGQVSLTRLDNSILAQIMGEATVKSECDRCLAEYDLDLPFQFNREYFLGGYREKEEDLLVSKHFQIDITDPIREEMLLAIPVQKLCQENCKGLCSKCGANLNQEKCKCPSGKI